MSSRVGLIYLGCVLICGLEPQSLLAQDANGSRGGRRNNSSPNPVTNSTPTDPDSSTVTHNLTGRVLNALTGAPVPRALVNVNGRAALTDPQGKFSFAAFAGSQAYAQVSKPGYTATPTPEANRQQRILDLDALIELKLYPEAVLTGLVTGPDSLPLARTQVHLRRLTFDGTGPRWLQAGFTQTDVHGAYRFQVAAGRYRLSTGFAERSVERGESVIPVSFPATSSSSNETFELTSGEQRQVDLRPRVGPAYPVTISLDGGDSDRGTRLVASTSSGLSFPIPAQTSDNVLTAQLPAGTFTLRAGTGNRDEALDGEARVVVSAHGINQVTIHLAPRATFPVETSYEVTPPANGSPTPTTPSPQQLNLSLHDVNDSGEGFSNDARLNIKPDKTTSFQVAPGRYRLGGSLNGAWFIRSATLGVTDLMTEELVVAPGSAGTLIRLTVSNIVGRVKGSVTTAGLPATGWVYMIPLQPSLIPSSEIYIQPDGSYQWQGAPGKYIAVSSSQQVREDFRNPAFLRKFTAAGREIDLQTGADASLDLVLAPAGVAR